MADKTQTCPRRLSDWGPWERAEGLDTWHPGNALGGGEPAGEACSFCGSLRPDRFMELVREGWIVGPTDKNYKAYLARPVTDDEIAARKAQWLETDRVAQAIRTNGADVDATDEQITASLEKHWTEQQLPLLRSGRQVAKFYYQHLSDEQRTEFIELINSGQMQIGYPGHLYVLPFFAQPRLDSTP